LLANRNVNKVFLINSVPEEEKGENTASDCKLIYMLFLVDVCE
jgi:hypothetical protein